MQHNKTPGWVSAIAHDIRAAAGAGESSLKKVRRMEAIEQEPVHRRRTSLSSATQSQDEDIRIQCSGRIRRPAEESPGLRAAAARRAGRGRTTLASRDVQISVGGCLSRRQGGLIGATGSLLLLTRFPRKASSLQEREHHAGEARGAWFGNNWGEESHGGVPDGAESHEVQRVELHEDFDVGPLLLEHAKTSQVRPADKKDEVGGRFIVQRAVGIEDVGLAPDGNFQRCQLIELRRDRGGLHVQFHGSHRRAQRIDAVVVKKSARDEGLSTRPIEEIDAGEFQRVVRGANLFGHTGLELLGGEAKCVDVR
jgi:hypothetical protein